MPLWVHVVVQIFMIAQLHTTFALLAAECCIPDWEIRAGAWAVPCLFCLPFWRQEDSAERVQGRVENPSGRCDWSMWLSVLALLGIDCVILSQTEPL